MAVTEPFCRFETADGADVVALLPNLNDAPWSEIEQVGSGLLERVRGSTAKVVLVDLTALNYMGSALVAMLVRVWKVVKDRGGRNGSVSRSWLESAMEA